METLIFDELKKYTDDKVIRYDVPGHKGNTNLKEYTDFFGTQILKADVNSMKRLDNLNNPHGVIKESQLNIAKIHNAQESRILVNGTTIGIITMILAAVKPGEKILVPRNVHKSVITGIFLAGAIPIYARTNFDEDLGIYTYLAYDEVVTKFEEYPDIKAILLINPAYFGICKEFEKIVKYSKKLNKTVLVDEAHGGHFYFTKKENITAMDAGADMSCISYHKLLGSLTQSSLLLHNSEKIKIEEVDHYLTMLTTTSPSYLLMTSVECSVAYLEQNGYDKFLEIRKKVKETKRKIDNIQGLSVIDAQSLEYHENEFDFAKLLIKVNDLGKSGFDVYEILRDQYNIQVELAEFNVILAIIGIGDDLNNLDILVEALQKISNTYYQKDNILKIKFPSIPQSNISISLREAFYAEKEKVKLDDSIGKICGEGIMIYPPGIEIIKIGEIFTEEHQIYIEKLLEKEVDILGISSQKEVITIKQ